MYWQVLLHRHWSLPIGTIPGPAEVILVISTVAVVAVTPPTLSLLNILPVIVAVVIGANGL